MLKFFKKTKSEDYDQYIKHLISKIKPALHNDSKLEDQLQKHKQAGRDKVMAFLRSELDRQNKALHSDSDKSEQYQQKSKNHDELIALDVQNINKTISAIDALKSLNTAKGSDKTPDNWQADEAKTKVHSEAKTEIIESTPPKGARRAPPQFISDTETGNVRMETAGEVRERENRAKEASASDDTPAPQQQEDRPRPK